MDARHSNLAVDELRRAHDELVARLLDRLPELAARMEQAGALVSYDDEDDTLTITLGSPEPAITESVDNTVFLRVRPGTTEIVGLELVGIRALAEEHPKTVLALLRLLQAAPAHFAGETMSPPDRQKRLIGGLYDLVASRS